jgi:hypothetical protein
MPESSASAVRARILPPLRAAATAVFLTLLGARIFAEQPPVPFPVPVDALDLVSGNVSPWRETAYEYYVIPGLPEFVVFDTHDYTFQSLMFKRLAFFVEKAGFTGRIHDYATVDPLRGYKAHNYYASDLAAFFNVAGSLGVDLLAEEQTLRRILIALGVLRRQGRLYTPGRGGVLSLSREASPALRSLHLGHELTHAIFYLNAEYRTFCYRLWDSTPEDVKRFWKLFLRWKDYEVEDTYLLVNEFQAYTLQQPAEKVESYLRETNVARMTAEMPESALFLEQVARRPGTPFRDTHLALHAGLVNALVKPEERRLLDYLDELVGR